MKKQPFKKFVKENNKHPIIGTMAGEGYQRKAAYKKIGTNCR